MGLALVWCILVLFLHMFLFYYVVLFSRKLSEKILLALGPGFAENFRERTLGIWDLRSFDVFWCCSCLCFCFIMWCYFPESCLQKFSYLLVHYLASVSLPICLSVCLSVWSGRGCPWSPREGLLDGYVSQSVYLIQCLF